MAKQDYFLDSRKNRSLDEKPDLNSKTRRNHISGNYYSFIEFILSPIHIETHLVAALHKTLYQS
jgi:hypothetical protein